MIWESTKRWLRDDALTAVGVLVVVAGLIVAGVAILRDIPDTIYHGTVIDKQAIPDGTTSSSLVIVVQADRQQLVFEAITGSQYVGLHLGDTCDFTTYKGT